MRGSLFIRIPVPHEYPFWYLQVQLSGKLCTNIYKPQQGKTIVIAVNENAAVIIDAISHLTFDQSSRNWSWRRAVLNDTSTNWQPGCASAPLTNHWASYFLPNCTLQAHVFKSDTLLNAWKSFLPDSLVYESQESLKPSLTMNLMNIPQQFQIEKDHWIKPLFIALAWKFRYEGILCNRWSRFSPAYGFSSRNVTWDEVGDTSRSILVTHFHDEKLDEI